MIKTLFCILYPFINSFICLFFLLYLYLLLTNIIDVNSNVFIFCFVLFSILVSLQLFIEVEVNIDYISFRQYLTNLYIVFLNINILIFITFIIQKLFNIQSDVGWFVLFLFNFFISLGLVREFIHYLFDFWKFVNKVNSICFFR